MVQIAATVLRGWSGHRAHRLAISRAFVPLLIIGGTGFLISVFYTAPPLKLVHRGLGEIATFLGFGPVMTLGAFYVQAGGSRGRRSWCRSPSASWSLIAVNEIPDRAGDAWAGKRTLPVQLLRNASSRCTARLRRRRSASSGQFTPEPCSSKGVLAITMVSFPGKAMALLMKISFEKTPEQPLVNVAINCTGYNPFTG